MSPIFGLNHDDTDEKHESQGRMFGLNTGNEGQGRMMGLDTGNDAADFEAGVWLMALVGVLAAAAPVAFLNPSLGFKKRSAESQEFSIIQRIGRSVMSALTNFNPEEL